MDISSHVNLVTLPYLDKLLRVPDTPVEAPEGPTQPVENGPLISNQFHVLTSLKKVDGSFLTADPQRLYES